MAAREVIELFLAHSIVKEGELDHFDLPSEIRLLPCGDALTDQDGKFSVKKIGEGKYVHKGCTKKIPIVFRV